MPFKSDKQRRFMHMEHPEIAQKWEHEAKRKKEKPVQKSYWGVEHGQEVSKADEMTPRKHQNAALQSERNSTSHFMNAGGNAALGAYLSRSSRRMGRPGMGTQASNFVHNTGVVARGLTKNPRQVKAAGKLMKINVKGNALGVAGIAGAGYVGDQVRRGFKDRKQATYHRSEAARLKQVKKSYEEADMSVSYWGVDHGDEVSKAFTRNKDKMSAGRATTAALLPGWHGAVAGKKGSKLKAAGTEYGTAMAGTALGSRFAGGPLIGGIAGGLGGAAISQKRGWLKTQPKMHKQPGT